MKRELAAIVCLSAWLVGVSALAGMEGDSSATLPPIVAQTYGAGGTIIMWHDVDGDQKADYKSAYVFKDGRLFLVEQTQLPQAEPESTSGR